MLASTPQDPEKVVYDQLLQASEDGSISPSDDGNDPTRRQTKSNKSLLHNITMFITKLVVVCLALWGVANIGRHTISISIARNNLRSCSCGGTTVAEAIKRGCTYTPLAIAWLPPHCLDMDLAEEFDRAAPGGEWEYWADINGTIPLSRHEVSMLADIPGGVFYTTQEWHVMHCM